MYHTVPPIEEYLGEEILERIERVLGGREPEVIGRFTQVLPNNWKLYVENVRDSYHASLLHLFFTTFELNRLSAPEDVYVFDGVARDNPKDHRIFALGEVRDLESVLDERTGVTSYPRLGRIGLEALTPLGEDEIRTSTDASGGLVVVGSVLVDFK